jgi:chemotaxis signal transduction protein
MNQLTLDNSERYCVFQCADRWYGVPAISVRSIVPQPETTSAPYSDPILEGIVHIQNEFLPVVSLQALTQIQYDQASTDSERQLAILLGPQGPWGLLIDKAESLASLEISLSEISDQQDKWARACTGSASYQNQILQILDPTALYEYAASLIGGFWQTESPQLSPVTMNS